MNYNTKDPIGVSDDPEKFGLKYFLKDKDGNWRPAVTLQSQTDYFVFNLEGKFVQGITNDEFPLILKNGSKPNAALFDSDAVFDEIIKELKIKSHVAKH
jgi:hypothetical protein